MRKREKETENCQEQKTDDEKEKEIREYKKQ